MSSDSRDFIEEAEVYDPLGFVVDEIEENPSTFGSHQFQSQQPTAPSQPVDFLAATHIGNPLEGRNVNDCSLGLPPPPL